MAKRQIKDYVFQPGTVSSSITYTNGIPSGSGTGYLVIPGKWELSRILLITNVTRGIILYNFADTVNTGALSAYVPGGQNLNGGEVTYTVDQLGNAPTAKLLKTVAGIGETRIFFKSIDTSAYSTSDQISIFVEENYTLVRNWADFGTDAIERNRSSMPVAMIDADFEYGLQSSKWQTVETVNNYPSVYEMPGIDVTVNYVTITPGKVAGNPTTFANVLVNTYPYAHGFVTNNPFTIQALDYTVTGFSRAQGTSITYSVYDTYSFNYWAKGNIYPATGAATANVRIDTPRTVIRDGGYYTGANLSVNTVVSNGANPSLITVNLSTAHGFSPGMPLLLDCSPTYNTNQFANLAGAFFSNAIPSASSINFTARGIVAAGTYTPNQSTNKIQMFTRPDGFFVHRPGDGGVLFGTGSPVHGGSAFRQTKQYFRYQSGKGYFYSTGVMFGPVFDILDMNAADPAILGDTGYANVYVTVPHGLQVGAVVRVAGIATSGYNGQYTVTSIVDDVTIQVKINTGVVLGAADGDVSQVPKLYVSKWYGAVVRSGPHDDANGMFWEYDGNTFNVVRRTSTLSLAGAANLVPNSSYITAINSNFTSQLKVGDRIVVKGMTHKITDITDAGNVTVAPFYRGNVTTYNNTIYKVADTRVNQVNFSHDSVDGNGHSGYKMDPNFVQMIGIQFSWYGAGFMDYMVRSNDGTFIIAHRFKQNNVNTTASMRSGNLPIRYQVVNEAAIPVVTLLTAMTTSGTDNIQIDNATYFPPSGYVLIDYEIVAYNSINSSGTYPILQGITRNAVQSQYIAGTNRNLYGIPSTSHPIGTGVELLTLTATPSVSHWGSSYILDGGFDFDRGYLFSYTANSVAVSGNTTSYFGIRLSPSASNGTTGDLGQRELLNRAQILLQEISVALPNVVNLPRHANTSILITGILNPFNYYDGTTWTPLNQNAFGSQPSLAQVAPKPQFTVSVDVNGTQTPGGPANALTYGQYAQPGEKLFEFVASPATVSTLDLTKVRELTQSAIGGRGTFPNGADTLYVTMQLLPNLDNTSFLGNVNISLRWREAQA